MRERRAPVYPKTAARGRSIRRRQANGGAIIKSAHKDLFGVAAGDVRHAWAANPPRTSRGRLFAKEAFIQIDGEVVHDACALSE